MYSYGPPHMAGQKQDDQLEHTYSSSVRIRDVALKTCQRRGTIGRSGERESGISVPAANDDDDDDDKTINDFYIKMKENGFKLTKGRSRRYPAQTITDADYANDIALLANTPTQAETLPHSRERAAMDLHVNSHKTEYMCFNHISTLNDSYLKLVDLVHLPKKQCLINRDRHQHVTSKGMNS